MSLIGPVWSLAQVCRIWPGKGRLNLVDAAVVKPSLLDPICPLCSHCHPILSSPSSPCNLIKGLWSITAWSQLLTSFMTGQSAVSCALWLSHVCDNWKVHYAGKICFTSIVCSEHWVQSLSTELTLNWLLITFLISRKHVHYYDIITWLILLYEYVTQQLKKIRSLLLAGAAEYDTFFQHLRLLDGAFKLSAKDLRSQVVREACITLG